MTAEKLPNLQIESWLPYVFCDGKTISGIDHADFERYTIWISLGFDSVIVRAEDPFDNLVNCQDLQEDSNILISAIEYITNIQKYYDMVCNDDSDV